MKTKTVSCTLDTLPPLTNAQRENIARLAALPADQIDTNDVPELTDGQFRSALRRRFHKEPKKQITARGDADVLEWLKSHGKGYQTRINEILREAMIRSSL